jgi:uncharacterized membrane protein (UPF0136 family)
MTLALQILVIIAILANAVIYGTDVFGAIVQRPALRRIDDRVLTQTMGNIHQVADRRLATITVIGLLTAAAAAVLSIVTGHWGAAVATSTATTAIVVFVAVYSRVSKPVNAALTAAAASDTIPGNARALQARWDSVITARALLQAVALLGLVVALMLL